MRLQNHKSKCLTIVIITMFLLSVATMCTAKVLYVKPSGNDNNNGLTWATAKKTIYGATLAAVANDQIWVTIGTYRELDGYSYPRLDIPEGISVYGGFVGKESTIGQRVLTCGTRAAKEGEASVIADTLVAVDSDVILDGFVIQNANQGDYSNVFITYATSCSISNCTIPGGNSNAAGIYVAAYSSPQITNCIISNNNMGIYVYSNSSATIENCIIENNTGSGVVGYGGVSLVENIIRNNTGFAAYGKIIGGGVFAVNLGMVGNTIEENNAEKGGGVAVSGGNLDSCFIEGNRFEENIASENGGAIYVFQNLSWCTIGSNVFESNYAFSNGGAIYDNSGGLLINNTFMRNFASYNGGAIYTNYIAETLATPTTIANCIFYNNKAEEGRSVYSNRNDTTLTYCDAYYNKPPYQAGCYIPWPPVVYPDDPYYDVDDYYGVSPGSGCINWNPLLTEDGHLSYSSRCRNAGTNSVWSGIVDPVDIDGEQRIAGTSVDIGADEYLTDHGDPGDPDDDDVICIDDAIVQWTGNNEFGITYGEGTRCGTRGPKHLAITNSQYNVDQNDVVDVCGIQANVGGEQLFIIESLTVTGSCQQLCCYVVTQGELCTNKYFLFSYLSNLGGGEQIGDDLYPISHYQVGCRNEGWNSTDALVRVAGKVVELDQSTPPTWFTIDDDSGPIIKVTVPSGTQLPSVNDRVILTGVSSYEENSSSGALDPIIEILDQSDIQSAGTGTVVTIDIYSGWNLVCPPLMPFDPSPVSVFTGFDLSTCCLYRYDYVNDDWTKYDSTEYPPGNSFGYISLGSAFYLYSSQSGTISYTGYPDGLSTGDAVTTFVISLPGEADELDEGGWHLIGCPFNHDIPISVDSPGDNICFSDGNDMKTWAEAAEAGWVQKCAESFDNVSKATFSVGFDNWTDDQYLRRGHGYWIMTLKDNLTMFVSDRTE